MKIRVLFQAQLRTVMRVSEAFRDCPPDATLFDLLTDLATEYRVNLRPHLFATDGSVRPSLLLIVNNAAVSQSQAASCRLSDGDCVTLMPPIGGG